MLTLTYVLVSGRELQPSPLFTMHSLLFFPFSFHSLSYLFILLTSCTLSFTALCLTFLFLLLLLLFLSFSFLSLLIHVSFVLLCHFVYLTFVYSYPFFNFLSFFLTLLDHIHCIILFILTSVPCPTPYLYR